jgi:hypothetical protein
MPITVPGASSIASGGVNNYVMTAVDTNSIQGEANLTFDGTDLVLADDKTISLGTGSDSQIYYDGTDTFWNLRDTGTGDLMIALGSSYPSPDAGKVHIWAATAGVIDAHANSMVAIENSSHAVIQLLSGTSSNAGMYFGTSDSAVQAIFQYAQDDNQFEWRIEAGSDNLHYGVGAFEFQEATTISTTAGNLTIGVATGADVLIGDNETILYVDGGTGSVGIGAAAYTGRALSFHGALSGINPMFISIYPGVVTASSGTTVRYAQIAPTDTQISAGVDIGTASTLALWEGVYTKNGDATIANTATLYIGDAATEGATANYALWVDSGDSRFDGNVGIGGSGNAIDHELHVEDSSSNSTPTIKIENDAIGYRFQVNGGDSDKFQVMDTTGFNTFLAFNPTTNDTNIGVAGSMVLINETINAFMTTGLTINQGAADDDIFGLKSSDVGHAMTAAAELDTFFRIRKVEATSGGANVSAFKDADGAAGYALYLSGHLGEAADTTDTTSGIAVTMLNAKITDGSTGVTAVHADGNAIAFTNDGTTHFIMKGDGDLHGSDTSIASLDSYEDAHLIRLLEHRRAEANNAKGFIRSKWDDFVKYNRQDLIEAGLFSECPEGEKSLLNLSQLWRLHNGAIWQGYTRQQEMQEKIDTLENRLLAIEGAK